MPIALNSQAYSVTEWIFVICILYAKEEVLTPSVRLPQPSDLSISAMNYSLNNPKIEIQCWTFRKNEGTEDAL